jgi:hypothetical protein
MTALGVQLSFDAVLAAGPPPRSPARTGRPRKPKKPVDTSPRVCRCDGRLVYRDDLGDLICGLCGRRKAAP